MLAATALNILGKVSAATGPIPLGIVYSDDFSIYANGSFGPFQGWSNDPTSIDSLQSGAVHRWQINSGSTPTTGTGPTGDAEGAGKYLFCESSGNNQAFWYFNLDSVGLDASANTFYVTFDYHMYSNAATDMYLSVQGWNGSVWAEIGRISGVQQATTNDPYLPQQFSSAGYTNAGFKFRLQFFKSDTGSLVQDAAIDNLEIWNGVPA